VQTAIKKAFGPTILGPEQQINRAALGQIVFTDPPSLRRLEAIIHPAVHRRVLALIKESSAAIIMIEAIKLLEGQLHHICHAIWVTTCSRELQLQRLRVCRGLAEETAVSRIDAQAPQAEKIRQADILIDTGGLMEDTRRQFAQAWSAIAQVK
jgi:dephospho-CoA kinase